MPRTASPSLARWIVLLNALVFVGLGVAFLLAPTQLAAIIDLDAITALARNDIRAVYGGIELGIGLFLLGTLRSGDVRLALRALILLFGSMILARLISIAIDGVPEHPGTLLLCVETCALLSALVGRSVARRHRP